jgi:TnsA endonuclease N terminal
MHLTEGPLEPLAMILLRMDPDVARVQVQPVQVTWQEGGRTRSYTPDIFIQFKPGLDGGFGDTPWLCEIKSRAELRDKWAEYRRRFREATRHARSHGWIFKILTDRELRSAASEVATFLRHAVDLPPDPPVQAKLLEGLARIGRTTPNGLLDATYPDRPERLCALRRIWELWARNLIDADGSRPPDPAKTEIWLPPPGTAPTSLCFIRSLLTGRGRKHKKRRRAK